MRCDIFSSLYAAFTFDLDFKQYNVTAIVCMHRVYKSHCADSFDRPTTLLST